MLMQSGSAELTPLKCPREASRARGNTEGAKGENNRESSLNGAASMRCGVTRNDRGIGNLQQLPQR